MSLLPSETQLTGRKKSDNDTDLFQPAFVVSSQSEWFYPYHAPSYLPTGMFVTSDVLVRCKYLG
jgi:hypothetical protein